MVSPTAVQPVLVLLTVLVMTDGSSDDGGNGPISSEYTDLLFTEARLASLGEF